jgi:hypothetical protein
MNFLVAAMIYGGEGMEMEILGCFASFDEYFSDELIANLPLFLPELPQHDDENEARLIFSKRPQHR